MTTRVDDFGIWSEAGNEKILLTQWTIFPDIIYFGETFRFTYSTDWVAWANNLDDRVKILCRFYYGEGNGTVSPSFALYPKEEEEIRYYPIPNNFRDTDVTQRKIGAKAVRYSRYISTSEPIADLFLQVEYLS